jgi:hypothetical protein
MLMNPNNYTVVETVAGSLSVYVRRITFAATNYSVYIKEVDRGPS